MWQDILITIVNIIFCVSLLPQVALGFRERKGVITHVTSIPTFIGCFAMAFAFFTMSLYLSAFTTFFVGFLWLLLFVQRMMYD